MSAHYIEQAREALDLLDITKVAVWPPREFPRRYFHRLQHAINLLEHQTERVIELACEVERLHGKNVALQSQLDAWDKIEQGKMKDKVAKVAINDPYADAWREEYRKMRDEGWRFEMYSEEGDWVFDEWCRDGYNIFTCDKDKYRIAHGPIPEGWEYAGFKNCNKGERFWPSGDAKEWMESLADNRKPKHHCIRRKEPVDTHAKAKATMPKGAEWCGHIERFEDGYLYFIFMPSHPSHWETSAAQALDKEPSQGIHCRIPINIEN